MDLDDSRKIQLVLFMYQLLNKNPPLFPAGKIVYMTYQGLKGTFIYAHGSWRYLN